MFVGKRVSKYLGCVGLLAALVAVSGCSEVEDTYTPVAEATTSEVKPVQKTNPASFGEGELVFKKKTPAEPSK